MSTCRFNHHQLESENEIDTSGDRNLVKVACLHPLGQYERDDLSQMTSNSIYLLDKAQSCFSEVFSSQVVVFTGKHQYYHGFSNIIIIC